MGTAIANTLDDDAANVVTHHSRAVAANAIYAKELLQINGESGLTHDKAGGSLTNGRSSAANIFDFENILRNAVASEVRKNGGIRIENRLTYSEDFSNVIWVTSIGGTGVSATKTPNYSSNPIDGAITACRLQLNKGAGSTSGDFAKLTYNTVFDGINIGDIWMKTNDNSTKYILFCGLKLTVTGTWKRFYGVPTGTVFSISVETSGYSASADLSIYQPSFSPSSKYQLSNFAPTRYISRNVIATPFNQNGYGVDGVTYDNYINNNVVKGGVVFDSLSDVIPNLENVTFYDDFNRANTSAGVISDSLQGIPWVLYGPKGAPLELPAATDGFIADKYYTYGGNANVYASVSLRNTVRRVGAMVRISELTEGAPTATTGAIIISSNSNIIENALHFTFTHLVYSLDVRKNGASHTTLIPSTSWPIPSSLLYNNDYFIDIQLSDDGQTVTLSVNDISVSVTNSNIADVLGNYVAFQNYNNAALSSLVNKIKYKAVWAREDSELPVQLTNYISLTSSKLSNSVSYLMHEKETDNLALFPRDLSNAYWNKTNCTATLTATGIDGVPNSATTLTATANNAVCTRAITSASSARITSIYARRRTGTGNVQLTQNNGGSWTTMSLNTTWQRFSLSSVTFANPTIGVLIATSGDSVDIDYFQHELGSYITSPISGSRTIDSIKIPLVVGTNFNQTKGICLLKLKMNFANSATAKSLLGTNTTATDFIHDNGSGAIALNDGTNTATADVSGWSVGDTLIIAAVWNTDTMSIHVKKNSNAWIDSANTTYDGAFPAGSNLLLCNANTDSIDIYHAQIIDTNMTFSASQTWIKANSATLTA